MKRNNSNDLTHNNSIDDKHSLFKLDIYLENNSMLKKTYSPLSIIFKSSAANMISRIVFGFAHIMITENEKMRIGSMSKTCINCFILTVEICDIWVAEIHKIFLFSIFCLTKRANSLD